MPLSRHSPIWARIPPPPLVKGLSDTVLVVWSDGKGPNGLYPKALEQAPYLEQAVFDDDTHWQKFPEIAAALTSLGFEQECFMVGVSEGTWAIGIGMKSKARWAACKLALAATLALEDDEVRLHLSAASKTVAQFLEDAGLQRLSISPSRASISTRLGSSRAQNRFGSAAARPSSAPVVVEDDQVAAVNSSSTCAHVTPLKSPLRAEETRKATPPPGPPPGRKATPPPGPPPGTRLSSAKQRGMLSRAGIKSPAPKLPDQPLESHWQFTPPSKLGPSMRGSVQAEAEALAAQKQSRSVAKRPSSAPVAAGATRSTAADNPSTGKQQKRKLQPDADVNRRLRTEDIPRPKPPPGPPPGALEQVAQTSSRHRSVYEVFQPTPPNHPPPAHCIAPTVEISDDEISYSQGEEVSDAEEEAEEEEGEEGEEQENEQLPNSLDSAPAILKVSLFTCGLSYWKEYGQDGLKHVDMRAFRDPSADWTLKQHDGHHPTILRRMTRHKLFKDWFCQDLKRDFHDWINEARFEEMENLNVVLFCKSGQHRSVAASIILKHVLEHEEGVECEIQHVCIRKCECQQCTGRGSAVARVLRSAREMWRAEYPWRR